MTSPNAPEPVHQRADAMLAALEAIERRGAAGSITQALADVAAAMVAVEAIDAAGRAKLADL